MKKKFFVILFLSLFAFSRTSYAVFDVFACIESVLEFKKEVEHKVAEIEKKLKDIETRARQGFDGASSCFKDPKSCNPQPLTDYLNRMNECQESFCKGEQKAYPAWGFAMPGSKMSSPAGPQDGLLLDIEQTYVYNRGQGNDLVNLKENRDNINRVVRQEIQLLFSKGATTHNDLQNEKDSELYYSKFENNDIDEILNAQNRIALLSASRLARILELRSGMISMAATSEMSLQNQEHVSE